MHQAIKQGADGLISFVDDSSSLGMRAVEGQIGFTGSANFWVLPDPHIQTEWENLKSGKSGCS